MLADISERAVPLELGCMEVTHLSFMACKVSAPMLASAKVVGGRSNRSGPMSAWWQQT